MPPPRAPIATSTLGGALGALGVVYGDIGTSPLYALRECFHGPHGLAVSEARVLGVLSLIFWALILVVLVKYLLIVMRADHDGEGGVLSLMALVCPEDGETGPRSAHRGLVLLGLFGAALLYGDAAITPAISVLSAVEGLEVLAPSLHAFVVPTTLVLLIGLFALQRRGTGSVGALFGPLSLCWFLTLAGLGLPEIVAMPGVWSAIDPRHALGLFAADGWAAFRILGSVFLVVTAARRSTRTWGTSGVVRSGGPGSASSCPPCSSTTSRRGPC